MKKNKIYIIMIMITFNLTYASYLNNSDIESESERSENSLEKEIIEEKKAINDNGLKTIIKLPEEIYSNHMDLMGQMFKIPSLNGITDKIKEELKYQVYETKNIIEKKTKEKTKEILRSPCCITIMLSLICILTLISYVMWTIYDACNKCANTFR